MVYYSHYYDTLGLLTSIDNVDYLEVTELGFILIPFTRKAWSIVGVL